MSCGACIWAAQAAAHTCTCTCPQHNLKACWPCIWLEPQAICSARWHTAVCNCLPKMHTGFWLPRGQPNPSDLQEPNQEDAAADPHSKAPQTHPCHMPPGASSVGDAAAKASPIRQTPTHNRSTPGSLKYSQQTIQTCLHTCLALLVTEGAETGAAVSSMHQGKLHHTSARLFDPNVDRLWLWGQP